MNDFIGKTCGQSLDLIAELFGPREALVFQGRRWTYAEAKAEIDAAAARLATLDLAPGDHVAIWLPNRPEFIWLWLGAAQSGLTAVVLNTRLAREEAAYQIRQSRAKALITPGAGAFRDFLGEAAAAGPFPDLRHVIALDPPGPEHPHVLDWSVAPPRPPPLPPAPRAEDPGRPCMIAYSSGTTALPKGILLTHVLWRKAFDAAVRMGVGPDDRQYLCVPLFGIMAQVNGVLTMWTRGGAVVLEERFDADLCLKALTAERITGMLLVPAMVKALLAHPDFAADRHSLRFGGAVTNDPMELETVITRLGVRDLINSYGMTETTGVLVRTRPDDPPDVRLRTQGRPMPGTEVRIADPESDAALPVGAEGEIQARGYCITPGYFDKPEETAAAFTPDGWFRTGDRGRLHPDGTLTFLGRLKDGYKHKGFNVSAAEVEYAVAQHPAVVEVKVVGLPHPEHGEEGAAFVVLRAPLTAAELDAFLQSRLSGYKRPAHLFAVDALPLTAGTGKVKIAALKEQAMARLSRKEGKAPQS
jgi:fatty-acyl-CoA synthase